VAYNVGCRDEIIMDIAEPTFLSNSKLTLNAGCLGSCAVSTALEASLSGGDPELVGADPVEVNEAAVGDKPVAVPLGEEVEEGLTNFRCHGG